MLKSILKASVYAACLLSCGFAQAVGLGGINVSTGLGQPLRADIEITAADKEDTSSLRATLATADAYKTAGIDYPSALPKLQFQVNQREDGSIYIRATTQQPINDPFVSLLVQLSWPTGKLLREYTFLLDPPGYKPEQPKPEVVTPIEPVLAQPAAEPVPMPATSAPVAEPVAQPAPLAPEPAAASEVPAAEALPAAVSAPGATPEMQAAQQPAVTPIAQNTQAPAEVAPAPVAREQIMVKRGDTLARIAAQVKPADVSLERMLVTLYRENAAVFDGHNMNRIRAGKILSMPSADAIKMMPQADAVKEVRVQAADWNAYRRKLAAARGVQPEHEAKQEVAGKITTAVTDKAVAAKEPAKEVLKLSKGEAPNDKTVGNGKATPQEKAIANEEDAAAKSKALKDTQERTALLEKNVQDMQHLAQLKQEAAAASASAAALPVLALNTASAPQAASGVAAVKPKPKPRPKMIMPTQPVVQPSLLDQLLDEPLYLAGAAALLLGLGGAGYMVKRRGVAGGGKKKHADAKPGNDALGESTITHVAMPMASSPDSGDFTQSALQTTSLATADAEEVDPIGEADLFLTFGRDAQAEEVLKEALKKNPNNLPVKLKLLSIYASRKDANAFYSCAREIKESGDEAAWKQTAAMGHEIDPGNPFYGGDAAIVAAPDKPVVAPAVDFDLGLASSTPTPIPAFDAGRATAALENPVQEKTLILSSADMKAAASKATQMDFDVTGPNLATPAAKLSSPSPDDTATMTMDDLVFDVTASQPNVPIVSAAPVLAPKPMADKDAGMEFTLDFPLESVPKVNPSVTTRDMGLDEITLNLDQTGVPTVEPSAPAAAASRNEHWQEVATKLDLAKAYQEMGDGAGAREILEEVLRDGDESQRASAQSLLQQL